MSVAMFGILATIAFLVFAAVSFTSLVWPSLYLRHLANPFMPNTPWNRVQMRVMGLILSLVMLMMFSGITQKISKVVAEFHHNILIALWLSMFAAPIFSLILWKFSVRTFVRRSYIEGINEDPVWERRMALLFCSLLAFIVGIAFLLAAKRYHS